MDSTPVSTWSEAFYLEFLDFIRQKKLAEALMLFHTHPEEEDALAILSRLAQDLAHDLGNTRDRAASYDLVRARDRATAHDLALYLEIARALASSFAGDPVAANNLANVLAKAYDCVHALPDELAFELIHSIERSKRITHFLSATVEREREQAADNVSTLTLRGVERLTTKTLVEEVAPFLQAMCELQRLISELKGEEYIAPAVISISQTTHITVTMSSSIAQAVQIIRTIVDPSFGKQEQQLADLKSEEKKLMLEARKWTLHEQRLQLQRLGTGVEKSEAELEWERQELRRIRLEHERLEQEVKRAQLELTERTIGIAVRIVNEVAPKLPERKRLTTIQEVVNVLTVIGNSRLRISSLSSIPRT
jgi:hypothetical protein